MLSTDRQTDRQTNQCYQNITSFAKEVINRNPEVCYPTHLGCCSGVNKNVVIFGDLTRNKDPNQRNISTFHVILEPRSLQQLAMKLIYNLRDVIPWQRLPRKLISQLGLSEYENVIRT